MQRAVTLLGHADVRTTMAYTHVLGRLYFEIPSLPLYCRPP